ncbi:MAG: S-layer protein domain-containing protein [Candidatus Methanoperedens sp.]
MKKVNINNYTKYPVINKIHVFLLVGIVISMLTQAAVAVDSSSCTPSDRIQIGLNYIDSGGWDPFEFNINNYLVQPINNLKYIVVRYGQPNEGDTNVDMYLIHPDGIKSPLSLGYYTLGAVRFLESNSSKLSEGEYKIEVYDSNNCYSLIFPIVLKKTMTVGETWYLDNNYALIAQSINAKVNPRTVRLILSKDGSQLDDKIVSLGEKYSYGNIFSTKIDAIFSGATAELVQFKETMFSFSGIQTNSAPSISTTGSQTAKASTQATQVPNYAPVETPLYVPPEAMPQQESSNWVLYGGVVAIIAIGRVVISKLRRGHVPGQSPEQPSRTGSDMVDKRDPSKVKSSKTDIKPTIEEKLLESDDLEIKRDYEVLDNKDLRFGILVTNRSNYTVNDVDVHLKYDRSLFSLKEKEVIILGNITKNNPKTAEYFLTPLVGCVHNSKISAIISYKDASDNPLTVQMRPKEVHCISAFLAEKPMTEEQFSELNESHNCLDKGIVFKDISPEAVTNFILDSAKNKRYVVKNSFVNGTHIIYLSSVAKDKTFYLITVIIRSENNLTKIGLKACSNNEGGINNFINEILKSLRHYITSIDSAREVENHQSIIIIDSPGAAGSLKGNAIGKDESYNYKSKR